MRIKSVIIGMSMVMMMGGSSFVYAKQQANMDNQNTQSDNTQINNVQGQEGQPNKNEKKEVVQPVYSVIDKVVFIGNTKISSKELEKTIAVKIGDIANEEIITDAMVKIAKLYQTKGMKVTITPVLHHISSGHLEIKFDIHEAENSANNH